MHCLHCSHKFTSRWAGNQFCSLTCSTSYRNEQKRAEKRLAYEADPKYCKHCSEPLPFEKYKTSNFCNKSCAAKHNNKDQTRKRGPAPKPPVCNVKFIKCEHTGLWYCNKDKQGRLRRKSPYIRSAKDEYYSRAAFRFNVYHYPNHFDLSLIEQYGWYTCPGKKRANETKNINGVSRDHMISIAEGLRNGYDPEVLAHPANCRLILHRDNKHKAEGSDLTYAELLENVRNWSG